MKRIILFLLFLLSIGSVNAQIHTRKANESAQDFANRIIPKGEETIHPVIETNWNNADEKVIITFWYEKQVEGNYTAFDAIGKMYVPIGGSKYKEILIDKVSENPMEAKIQSVFFYDIDGDGTRELAVLYSWDYKHYMMAGTFYSVYIYDTIDYTNLPDKLTCLEQVYGGKTGNDDTGAESVAKFSTAAEAKNYLNKLGKVQKSKLVFKRSLAGKIGNFPVTFTVDVSGSGIKGTYFYNKRGMDINITGDYSRNGKADIIELDYKNEYQASIKGKFTPTGFTGTWTSKANKTYPVTLKNLDYIVDPLPENIAGTYRTKGISQGDKKEDGCFIELQITQAEGTYKYNLTVNDKVYKGGVSFGRAGEGNRQELYIVLEGYKWATNLGNVSDPNKPEVDTPAYGLDFYWNGDGELILQNYGNAMNHYLKISACDDKYIELEKIK